MPGDVPTPHLNPEWAPRFLLENLIARVEHLDRLVENTREILAQVLEKHNELVDALKKAQGGQRLPQPRGFPRQ